MTRSNEVSSMRFFAIAADVAMGVFVGIFLFAVLTRFWPSLATTLVGVVVVAASILIVLFRRPNGSLVPHRDRSS
jgi:Mg/Co/Ni transporter MgtE